MNPVRRLTLFQTHTFFLSALYFALIAFSAICGVAQTVTFTGAQSTIATVPSGISLSPITVDNTGNIFAVETEGTVKRLIKVLPSGTKVVLNSNFTFSPHSIGVNAAGTSIYFIYSGAADCGGITYEHVAKTTISGNIAADPTALPCSFTFASIGWNAAYTDPHDLKIDSAGNVYLADFGGGLIWKIPAGGTVPTQYLSLFNQPYDLALSADGNYIYYTYMLWSGSTYQNALARVPVSAFTSGMSSGTSATVISTSLTSIQSGLIIDSYGTIYVGGTITSGAYAGDSVIYKVTGSTLTTVTPPSPNSIYSFGVDSSGYFYTSGSDNYGNSVISNTSFFGVGLGSRKVWSTSAATPIEFLFNTGGQLGSIEVLTDGAAGKDFANKGTGSCNTTTSVATNSVCTVDVTFTPSTTGLRKGAVVLKNQSGAVIATVYIYGTGLNPQLAFTPSAQSTISTSLTNPSGVAVDASGNIYVADTGAHRVLKQTPSGSGYVESVVATSANGLSSPTGITVDGAGNIYIADSSTNRIYKATYSSGSYAISTAISSGLSAPLAVAVDGSGNLYIADSGSNRVLKETLTSTYTQSVIGSGLSSPSGVAVDASGNVYIADSNNDRVLKETLSGTTYTQSVVASGAIDNPTSVAVDAAGNVYVTDKNNKRLLRESVAGASYSQTVIASSTDGISSPSGVAVDGSGNIYFTDASNNSLSTIAVSSPPTFSFATKALGTRSPDSPQNLTLTNIGNQTLTFPVPSSGYNPTLGADFSLESSTTCGTLSSSSSNSFTLAAGSSCVYAISFVPPNYGNYSEWLGMSYSEISGTNISLIGVASFPISITPSSLPNGTYGTAYSGQLIASSGTAPYTFANTAGTIPSGLTLAPDGSISGTPSMPGSYTFTVTASDSASHTGTQNYTVVIDKAAQATVTITTPASAVFGQSGLSASGLGGSGTGVFSFNAGASTACSVNAATGALSITSGTGTCSITATRAADSYYLAATSAPASISIGQATQSTINVTVPISASYQQAGLTATASGGNSSNAFTYSAGASTACTVNSTTGALSITAGTGTCSITASRAADTNYLAATSAPASITINKASQAAVTLTAPSSATYGQTGLMVLASGGSGTGTISYSAGTSSACSVDANSGSLTISSGTGTCSITATRAGDANYTDGVSAVSSIAINKAGQAALALTAPTSAIYGQTGLTVSATGGTGTGLITYSAGTSSACSVDANSGALTITSGTGTCSITATRAADANYSAASSTASPIIIGKATQAAVMLALPTSAVYAQSGLSAVASGGNGTGAYSYSSTGSTACSVDASSGALTITSGTGTCSITATRAADTNYLAASGTTSSITINKATQAAVTLSAPSSATYAQTGITVSASGGSGTGTYTFSAGTSTACTVNATTGVLAITSGTGTCSLTATRAGDTNYVDASSTSTAITINKAIQTAVSLIAPSSATYAQTGLSVTASGGSGTGTLAFSAGSSTACSVDANSGALTITTGTGTCAITASRAGDTNYANATSVASTISINKATQAAVTVTVPASAVYGQSGLNAAASGGNGAGAYSYSASGSTACSVDANSGGLTFTAGTGSCSITAKRATDANYLESATSSASVISVSKAPASVTPNGATKVYDNNASTDPTLTGTVSGFLASDGIAVNYSRTLGQTVTGGPYTISANISANPALANYSITNNTASFTISVRPLTITATNAETTYNKAIPQPTGTVTGAADGDSITATFSTPAVVGFNAGSYPITAAVNASSQLLSNYNVTNTPGTLTIAPAPGTQVVLSSSPATVYYGQPVTFTAKASNTAGTPSGTVNLVDGSAIIGTITLINGEGTYTTSSLAGGTHNVVAMYTGSTNFVSASSNDVTQVIHASTITFDGAIGSVTLPQGGNGATHFSISATGTLTSDVSLSCTGLPAGLNCGLSRNSISPENMPATVNVTIASVNIAAANHAGRGSAIMLACAIGMVIPGLVIIPRKRQLIVAFVMIVLCLLTVLLMSGCEGAYSKGVPSNLTPSGTYKVTITATSSGAIATSSSFDVVVK